MAGNGLIPTGRRTRRSRSLARASGTIQGPPADLPTRAIEVEPGAITWWAAAAVIVVALFVRLLHVWQLSGAPYFTHLLGDSQGYDAWAQRLAAGDWLGEGVFYQAPLYPYALGGFYALAGHDLFSVRLVQAGIGALSSGLVTLAGAVWFGRRAGILAGVLLAFYPTAVFFDGLIQKSVLDGVLVSGLLLALGWMRGHSVGAAGIGAGALLGLLALNRENALALLPIVAVWVWVRSSRRLRAVALTLGTAAVVLAPVAIRNAAVGGELHLTTSQLGPNFYIGNNPRATGSYVPLRADRASVEFEQQDATRIAEAEVGRPLRPSEVSAYWLRRGVRWIASDPAAWLRLTGRKFLLLVNRTEPADTEDAASHGEWSVFLRLGSVLHFGVLVPLGLLGAWITRDRWRDLWPLHALPAVLAGGVLCFYVLDRYRYPLVPVLVLLAGAAGAGLGRYWRDNGPGERAKVLGLAAAAALICNWPLLSATDMQALTHYNVGSMLGKEGLEREAEAEYRTALALQPALASAHSNLCALLQARGHLPEALRHCREAVDLDPQSPTACVNLGVVLGSSGRTDEAVEAFSRALRLDPLDADAHYNIARALALRGQTGPAIEHLQEALRIEPSNAAAHNSLGVLLCLEGRLADGTQHFRTALRIAPGYREAAANLEHALRKAREGP